MPLKKGSSPKTISENIKEFHKGPSFKHTEQKYGKNDADKQAIAVAFSEARRSKEKGHSKEGSIKFHNEPSI